MKNSALLSQFGALCVVLLVLVAGRVESRAQATTEVVPVGPTSLGELSQAELLKSYLQVREQLHATQLANVREQLQAAQQAIVTNRAEAEAVARAQAAAVAEKLESLRLAMEAERQRQQLELQRSNRTTMWVAALFGGLGLLAVIGAPLLQWRALNRMTELSALRPALPGAPQQALLAAETGTADQAVALSNQRLVSVIDRMERRIFDLEHTTATPATPATPPSAAAAANGTSDAESARRATASSDQEAWITVLMSKGRSLLSTNKVREAVTCYDEILKLDLNHPEALVRKGSALERLNRYEEAIQCYDRAIEADRTMTLAYVYKGGVCNRLERYDQALECYEQALRAQEKEPRK